MPVCLVAGREIVCVEGVGCASKLHPVQAKMVGHLGSQCGYCTPGFICSLFEGYYREDLKTHEILMSNLPVTFAVARAIVRFATPRSKPSRKAA